ncbi:hypothetical protein J7337_009270 [Fusarium musae]|uniref:Uncharacterized protein n=1 Tax=Fusarium musae TaxID=1042133 RepID=A0A9P8DAR2_9HYPO|nr:hypothetical protein J7337_009270 [Fusarium musae]KAG9498465.1 hypothetical protein J7337_009270 [Fusarium musae]
MASAAFDHSGVNPLNLSSRRIHMEAFFKHLGVWDSAKVKKIRDKCVEKYCHFLDEQGYTTINHEYFEYQVDNLVWHNVLKIGKVSTEANEWPWLETVPAKHDLTIQVSLVYKDWLSRNSSAKGKEEDNEPSQPQQHQVPAAPMTGESSKATQGTRSTAAGGSKSSVAAQSNSNPRPPVIIRCPGGETVYAMSESECGQAAFEDMLPVPGRQRGFKFGRAERGSGDSNASLGIGISAFGSLAGQLLHVHEDMEKLQKQKEEIIEQIESRGGHIEEPKK